MTSKTFILSAFILCSLAASAADSDEVERIRQARKAFDRAVYERTGGEVRKPGKGAVLLVNGQHLVSGDVIKSAIDSLAAQTELNFQVVDSRPAEASPGGITIEIMDDGQNKPPMLAAPESGWARVNVGALSPDIRSKTGIEKFLPLRFKKMLTRAFAYACGAGGSGYEDNILDTVFIRDLDYRENVLPVDALSLILKHAATRGITSATIKTYRQACEQGWAPAPTNDVQKAIWEKVHTPPTKPLKISYDKAAQKPVVK